MDAFGRFGSLLSIAMIGRSTGIWTAVKGRCTEVYNILNEAVVTELFIQQAFCRHQFGDQECTDL
jgi:hypothetical protein